MTGAALLLLSAAGFAVLLLAMARHQQDWLGRKLPRQMSQRLRLSGFALLALSFFVAGLGFGWGYGAVLWAGSASAGAALAVAVNINRERLIGKARHDKTQ